jgi:phage shock protein C
MTTGFREAGSGFYRSRHGVLFGVCRGVAERYDLSVFGVRAATVLIALCTGIWPVAAVYIATALILKLEPPYYDY